MAADLKATATQDGRLTLFVRLACAIWGSATIAVVYTCDREGRVYHDKYYGSVAWSINGLNGYIMRSATQCANSMVHTLEHQTSHNAKTPMLLCFVLTLASSRRRSIVHQPSFRCLKTSAPLLPISSAPSSSAPSMLLQTSMPRCRQDSTARPL
jgi:hypothetical protein